MWYLIDTSIRCLVVDKVEKMDNGDLEFFLRFPYKKPICYCLRITQDLMNKLIITNDSRTTAVSTSLKHLLHLTIDGNILIHNFQIHTGITFGVPFDCIQRLSKIARDNKY